MVVSLGRVQYYLHLDLIANNSNFLPNQLVLGILTARASGQKTACGLYGQPPCTFVPVPKGATPPCAGLGKTYCEHVPNYPK